MSIDNMKISTKVASAALLPLLAMLLFSIILIYQNTTTYLEMNSLNKLIALAPKVSNLVHALQKERGASAGYLGSNGGTVFERRLAEQRQETDLKYEAFQEALAGFDVSGSSAGLQQRVQHAKTSLEKLASSRAEVLSQKLSVTQMADYYTGTIAGLLEIIGVSARLSSEASVTSLLTSYLSFLQMKERAGIERAMGSNGFSAASFSATVYNRFVGLIARQQAYEQIFFTFANQSMVDYYNEAQKKEVFSQVESMRQVAINAGVGGAVSEVRDTVWFDTITKKINVLKNVEDHIKDEVLQQAETIETTALTVMAIFIVVSLVAIVVIGLFSKSIVTNIANPIKKMTDSVALLAEGDQNVVIEGGSRQDEIGAMVRSLDVIRTTGMRALRIQTALENSAGAIMICDNEGGIIFINTALQSLFTSRLDQIKVTVPGFELAKINEINVSETFNLPVFSADFLVNGDTVVKEELNSGKAVFVIMAAPVKDPSGIRIGTVYEWIDVTNERATQNEIAAVVGAAADGDFTKRLTENGREGFFLSLSQNFNSLMKTAEEGLDRLQVILQAMASADFTQKMEGDFKGVFLNLQNYTNNTTSQLSQVISEIRESVQQLKMVAEQVSTASQTISQNATEQAAGVEETSASLEQVTQQAKENEKYARETSSLSSEAATDAEKGGIVVSETVQSMQRIVQEISVIEEIAYQTNLLALNAAIEAARAGSHGKGFAVVATEVRKLAEKSQKAAQHIQQIAGESVKVANEAGTLINRIVPAVEKTNTLVNQISESSTEQQTGIAEINNAVSQLESMAQQNASTAEELAATSEQMSSQAMQLDQRVSLFKVNADD